MNTVSIEVDERRVEAVQTLLARLDELETIVASGSTELPGLGQRPSGEALSAAVARNEARVWAARRRVYDGALSRREAADRLGVSPNQVTNLLRDGELVAIDGSDGIRVLEWQLAADTRKGRVEGIARVVEVFPLGPVSLAQWMTRPDPGLGGVTPCQALIEGRSDDVVAAAASIG